MRNGKFEPIAIGLELKLKNYGTQLALDKHISSYHNSLFTLTKPRYPPTPFPFIAREQFSLIFLLLSYTYRQ